jgi:hypothetical protein
MISSRSSIKNLFSPADVCLILIFVGETAASGEAMAVAMAMAVVEAVAEVGAEEVA